MLHSCNHSDAAVVLFVGSSEDFRKNPSSPDHHHHQGIEAFWNRHVVYCNWAYNPDHVLFCGYICVYKLLYVNILIQLPHNHWIRLIFVLLIIVYKLLFIRYTK